jgi:hypothetical protein
MSKEANKEYIVMEFMPPWKVKLTYFKTSGKFYTEGEYTSEKLHIYQIFEEIKKMLTEGNWPGLTEGSHEFITLAEIPEHPHNHPALIIPAYLRINMES